MTSWRMELSRTPIYKCERDMDIRIVLQLQLSGALSLRFTIMFLYHDGREGTISFLL